MEKTEQTIHKPASDQGAKGWHFAVTAEQAFALHNLAKGMGRLPVVLNPETGERVERNRDGTLTYYSPKGDTPAMMSIERATLLTEMERLHALHAAGTFGDGY